MKLSNLNPNHITILKNIKVVCYSIDLFNCLKTFQMYDKVEVMCRLSDHLNFLFGQIHKEERKIELNGKLYIFLFELINTVV